MKNNRSRQRILVILLSSIIATTGLSNTSVKVNNRKGYLYNTLASNDYLDDEIDVLYSILVDDLNYGKTKYIYNKLNYLYYKFIVSSSSYYYDYLDSLTGEYLTLPNDNEMVFQGITCVLDKVIISAYNENRIYRSCLYVIDKETNDIRRVELDNNSHVGGIAYDDVNDLLWVTVRDKLYGYRINDILFKDKVEKKYETINLEDMGNCSFLAYKDNRIYIGNYDMNKNSIVKVYKLSKSKINSNINFIPETILIIPSKVQGMDFIDIGEKEYLLLSRSCYIFNDSEILIYEYDKDRSRYTSNYVSVIKCPPMLEEIKMDNNYLMTLFESGSSKYKDCLSNMNHIYYNNIKKKIKTNNY